MAWSSDNRTLRALLGWVLFVGIASRAALAQTPVSVPLPPGVALEDVRRAYRERPFSDLVTISVSRMGSRGRISEDLRVSGLAKFPERPLRRAVRLDLNVLDVYAWTEGNAPLPGVGAGEGEKQGECVVVSDRDDARYVRADLRRPLSSRSFEGLLPAIPAPQLDLAFGSEWPPRRFTPYADGVEWLEAAMPDGEAGSTAEITGRFPDGTLRVTISVRTGRLLGFRIERDDLGLTIEARVTDAGEDDPNAWGVDVTGRQPVASVSELRRRPALVGVGRKATGLGLLTLDGQAWDPGASAPLARPVAIVFAREEADGAVETGAELVRELHADLGDRVAVVGALVVRPGRAGLADRLGAWRDSLGEVAMTSGVVWSPSAEASIERIARGANVGVLAIDAQGEVRASFDGFGLQASGVLTQVRSALGLPKEGAPTP